jgi:prepilin-type processing-associated H-X9-DG protein
LIELLIVIAIISILAAILFPVFATAREKARQTVCSSDLKQIGLATMQYLQDYDEAFPCGTQYGVQYADHGCGWAYQIYAYVKTTKAFLCPDDAKGNQVSYIGNSNVFGAAQSLRKETSPSNTVLLAEMQGFPYAFVTDRYMYDQTPTFDGLDWAWNSSTGQAANYWGPSLTTTFVIATGWLGNYTQGRAQNGPHNDGANYMFCDGHVKWLMGSRVSPGSNASSPNSAQVSGTFGTASGTNESTYAVTFSTI